MNRPVPVAILRPRRSVPAAITLFEVAVSLLLVSFGVVSVLMIFPVGQRQTQASRYKILAAAKAVEMVDSFAGSIDEVRMLDCEVPEPWEGRSFAYSNNRPDLEQRTCNFRYGIHPLPLQIARRLDSEGNEIRRVLDNGGYIYYAMPTPNANMDERWQPSAPLNEARCVVFAVIGDAQHNAIPRLPQKAWPYRNPYPAPPQHMASDNDFYLKDCPGYFPGSLNPAQYSAVASEWWLAGTARLDHVLTNTPNPLFKDMFTAFMNYAYYKKANTNPPPRAPRRTSGPVASISP